MDSKNHLHCREIRLTGAYQEEIASLKRLIAETSEHRSKKFRKRVARLEQLEVLANGGIAPQDRFQGRGAKGFQGIPRDSKRP